MAIPIWPITNEAINQAAQAIKAGGLIAFPTETVYGLGADATKGPAIARIFATKGRPAINPLIVHVLDVSQACQYAVFDDRARIVAHMFWPGPLTLVLPKTIHSLIHPLVTAGLETVALRSPAHPVARDLIKATGLPIAAPSANKSGRLSPTAPHHVAASLSEGVVAILAGGKSAVGLESTVLDLSGPVPAILRPGAITAQQLSAVLECDVLYDMAQPDSPKSPGQLLAHYAPSIPVRLGAVDVLPDEALLAFGSVKFMGIKGGGFAQDLPPDQFRNLSQTGDLIEAAANLFAYLNDLDNPAFKKIAVMNIPDQGLGVAINDRLKKAAGLA